MSYFHSNPFLNMLAALEEDVEAGGSGQDNPPAGGQGGGMRNANVKLPEYWAHSPGIWFARVELRFEVCGIVSERERFAHAVNALTQEASRLVTDLIIAPPAVNPYTILKERLLIAHQLTPVQKAMKVMAMPTLGDRRPSQLLADMLEYCPVEEERSAFFRAAFVQRLPAELQVLLDGVEDADLKDLATKADKLWTIRRPVTYQVAALNPEQVELVEDPMVVAAVKPQYKNKNGGKAANSEGNKKRQPKLYSVCFKHMKYGADAHRCDDPANCRWAGN